MMNSCKCISKQAQYQFKNLLNESSTQKSHNKHPTIDSEQPGLFGPFYRALRRPQMGLQQMKWQRVLSSVQEK